MFLFLNLGIYLILLVITTISLILVYKFGVLLESIVNSNSTDFKVFYVNLVYAKKVIKKPYCDY